MAVRIPPEKQAQVRAAFAQGKNGAEAARAAGVDPATARKIRREMLATAVSGGRPGAKASRPSVAAPPTPPDPVEESRKDQRIRVLSAEIHHLTERARKAEDLRAGVLGLVAGPRDVADLPSSPGNARARSETIVLFLSDLHWGERIDLAAMDGLNAYDLDIARARLLRYWQAVIDLATKHWSGPAPERVILVLGGDLISGEIHAELAKTNVAKSLPAVRDVVGHLATGIRRLAEALKCPIDILSIAGNHGRSTLKPEAKESVETSYDTLVADFLEMDLAGVPRLAFYKPVSTDALFSVYGWRVLATHGDRIGSRGGQGHIGPAATAARGFKRIVGDYAARGVHLDLILIGHFHTALMLEEGFVNGTLAGPSEYSRDGRFRPAPARQLFLSIHPRRGVSQVRWVHVGHEGEGSLYAPPPEDRELRPRYRVPAVRRQEV